MEDLNNNAKNPGSDLTKEELPSKQDIRLLLVCFLLGFLANLLFYGKSLGISYPVFILCFYTVFLWRQRESFTYSLSFGWALSVPIILAWRRR